MNEEGDLEYTVSYRNDHGTGFDLAVSNPVDGFVDIIIIQVVGHEVPEEPSVTLSIPHEAALAMMRAMGYGTHVAATVNRLKSYN